MTYIQSYSGTAIPAYRYNARQAQIQHIQTLYRHTVDTDIQFTTRTTIQTYRHTALYRLYNMVHTDISFHTRTTTDTDIHWIMRQGYSSWAGSHRHTDIQTYIHAYRHTDSQIQTCKCRHPTDIQDDTDSTDPLCRDM